MWVKICGITGVSDARMIAAAGADAIGLNFYPPSRRFLSIDQAKLIRDAVPARLEVVGVFVNATLETLVETAIQSQLTCVQFHGDETVADIAEFHRQLPDVDIVRAFRVGEEGTADVEEAVRQLRAADVTLKAILVDALVVGEYGGTGQTVDPQWLTMDSDEWPPLILAGGLTPQNVAQAISQVRPWGVDTASGVEESAGIKSASSVAEFIRQARSVS